MKCGQPIHKPKRVRRILAAVSFSLLVAALPFSSNALAADVNARAPAPTTQSIPCSFASPNFGDKVCAAGEVVLLAPVAIGLGVPMLVLWGGAALAMAPFVPAGGRNPMD